MHDKDISAGIDEESLRVIRKSKEEVVIETVSLPDDVDEEIPGSLPFVATQYAEVLVRSRQLPVKLLQKHYERTLWFINLDHQI